MQTPKPIFLFTFANDDTQTLRLDEEWRQAEKALQEKEDAGKLIFHLSPSTTFEDIFDKFNRFHNQITIFHYGGHSDGNSLNLVDKPIRNQTLATLIGQEENLKLVFLNGCSNAQQVKVLFENNVPAVIATSLPISDKRAIDFSKQFYQALTAGRSIRGAFDVAAEYINNSEKDIAVSYRSLALERPPKAFEWGLYVNDKSVLDWKIPAGEKVSNKTVWWKWVGYAALVIGILAGIAEFSGYSLKDLFQQESVTPPGETTDSGTSADSLNQNVPAKETKPAPPSEVIKTSGDQSPAIKSDGDVQINYGKIEKQPKEKEESKEPEKLEESKPKGGLHVETKGDQSPAVVGDKVNISYGDFEFPEEEETTKKDTTKKQ